MNVHTNNENAQRAMGVMRAQLDEIDAELLSLVDKLLGGEISEAGAVVREIALKGRRGIIQNQYNAVSASVKHF